MPITEITSEDQLEKIINDSGDKLVVVKFFATWCGPCRMMAPKFLKMSEEFPNVVCVEVDVDELNSLAQLHGVDVMPTFFFFKKGQEKGTMSTNSGKTSKNAHRIEPTPTKVY